MKVSTAVKTGLFTTVTLCLLCSIVIGWSLFTARGTNASLSVLQDRMQNLSYTYKSGNLAQGIIFDDLKWNLKNKTQISATGLEVNWNPACWRGKELCLKSATVNEVKIVMAQAKKKNNPITLPPVKLPFSIISDSLHIDKLIIENGAPKPIVFTNIDFNGSLQDSILNAESLTFDWQFIHASTQGKIRLNKNYPVEFSGQISNKEELLSLPLQSRLSIGGDLLNMQITASLSAPYPVKITGSTSPLTRDFPVDLDIDWKTTEWPRASDAPQFFVDNGQLKLTGFWPDYDLAGTSNLHGTVIPSADVKIKGSINTKRATFNPLQLQTLDGVIDATGVFKWRNGLSWQATLNTDLIKPGNYWPEFDGNIKGSAILSGRNNNGLTQINLTDINTTGEFQKHPFAITGNASKSAEGTYFLSGLEAKSLNNTLSANGKIDDDSDLSLYFSLKSPEDFIPELQGDLNGNLSISGNIRKPDIIGSASSSALGYRDMSLVNTKFEGILRAMGEEESEIKVVAQKFVAKGRKVVNASVKINGSRSDHFLRANLSSPPVSIDHLEVIGSFDEYNNWTGRVNEVKGNLGEYPAWLDKPFATTWIKDSQTLALQPHCWSVNLASACVRESALLGKTGVVNFAFDGLDLQAIEGLMPPNLAAQGNLRSRGALKWGPNTKTSINLDTQIDNAILTIIDPKTQEKYKLDFSNVDIDTITENSLINTTLNLDAERLGHLDANIAIDAGRDNYPLSGSITLSDSQLRWLKSYAPQLSKLEGKVSGDATLGGSLSAPELAGELNITEASIASPLIPLDLSAIALDLSLNGKTAELTGKGKAGGQDVVLQGSGKIIGQSWESDLRIKANRIPVQHEYLENAVVSPDLNIKLSPNGIKIGGKITVPKANIKIDSFGGNGIPLSRDVVIIDAEEPASTSRNKLQHNISSQIDVVLGRSVHFDGYGLSADLRGDFTVKISPDRTPELLGAMMVDSGTYRSYGQNLRIKDGRLNFVGPLEQAVLSVEAVRDIGDIMVGLRIDGSLQNPNTALFSEPQLPEDEILSYIVLGRQLQFGDDSPDDTQLLANAALFMGISNGRAFSQNVAKSLGIDDFALSASGTGEDTQVMLSGRLNNRLLVRYGVGIFNSVNTLFLRYDLAEKLYLETTQGLEKAVDLFYSFEFD